MKALWKKLMNNEDGQSMVLVALLIVVLLSAAALAIDLGSIHLTKIDMQNAADAAAVAGAKDLPSESAAVDASEKYASLNGVDKSNVTVTPCYNGNSNQIEVICTKKIKYSFARILGLTDTEVSGRAVAQKSSLGGAFEHTIFSGANYFTLAINGSAFYVEGSIHSNYDLVINGSNQNIDGSVEAVSNFIMNGSDQTISGNCQAANIITRGNNITIGNQIREAASWIDMPDFSEQIKAEAEAAGQVYSGNKTYNGCNVSVDSPIYVNGNLTVNGDSFKGKGVILVSGDITFNGSNISSTGSSVCFYSQNGNIYINGDSIVLDGLVYAPNGNIIMNGSNQTINGRVIADKVTFNGSNYKFIANADDLDCLPSSGTVSLVE
jgi:hypothetical protein